MRIRQQILKVNEGGTWVSEDIRHVFHVMLSPGEEMNITGFKLHRMVLDLGNSRTGVLCTVPSRIGVQWALTSLLETS